MPDVTVSTFGPIFNGTATREARALVDAYQEELAQTAYDRVMNRLDVVLQHPTGYYQSQVRINRQADSIVVDDNGVIYGNWLEGTGSRNYPTTRFKGYSTFRLVAQGVDKDAPLLGKLMIDRFLAVINGV